MIPFSAASIHFILLQCWKESASVWGEGSFQEGQRDKVLLKWKISLLHLSASLLVAPLSLCWRCPKVHIWNSHTAAEKQKRPPLKERNKFKVQGLLVAWLFLSKNVFRLMPHFTKIQTHIWNIHSLERVSFPYCVTPPVHCEIWSAVECGLKFKLDGKGIILKLL